MPVWHWVLHVTGVKDSGSYWAAFWSGFGSDLAEFAIIAVVWRKVNCHAKGCWRVGMHHVEGTHFITCRKHHPVHRGGAATADDIARAHAAAHLRATEPKPAEETASQPQ
jgi:hypothetical protein